MHRLLLKAIATLTLAAPLAAETVGVVDTDIGQVLVAAETGMTLYTFDQDAQDQSNCYGGCAASWPPFLASNTAQSQGWLGVIDRNDGTRQWTLNGQPLYFWQGDAQIGDTSGHGVGGVWFAALY